MCAEGRTVADRKNHPEAPAGHRLGDLVVLIGEGPDGTSGIIGARVTLAGCVVVAFWPLDGGPDEDEVSRGAEPR